MAGAALIYPPRRLHPNGLDAWAEVKQRGYEGLVAKHEASVPITPLAGSLVSADWWFLDELVLLVAWWRVGLAGRLAEISMITLGRHALEVPRVNGACEAQDPEYGTPALPCVLEQLLPRCRRMAPCARAGFML